MVISSSPTKKALPIKELLTLIDGASVVLHAVLAYWRTRG